MPSVPEWTSGLWGVDGIRARLAYYPPDLRQDAHNHDVPHVSVVVAGSFRETTPGGERFVCHGSTGFRADGARHSVRFGPAGALILTVALRDWTADGVPRGGVRWVGTASPFARDLLSLARRGGEQECDEMADRLIDLWSTSPASDRHICRTPPGWLDAAAEQLLDEPEAISIAGVAARAGVHRVHFARCFRRHFGLAPSVFRRRAMASRVLSAALGNDSRLAEVAAEAGFADQSHMARTVRETCAMSVGEIRRRLRGEVTSVQAVGRATG